MRRRDFLHLPFVGLLARAGLTGSGAGALRDRAQGRTKNSDGRTQGDLRLWYRRPAANWNEALPVGNGRLAAMVFGGFPEERIQINEDTVWAGERRDRLNPEGARSLPEVLRFQGQEQPADYTRELDLDSAVARVTYESGGARFTREVFASAVDQVIVVRLTCDRPGRISFAATLTREQDVRARAAAPDRVLIEGEAIPRGDRHP